MRNIKQINIFLSFQIGKETFAVSVQKVLEVLQKQYITEIPNVPEFVEGVINFRGKIIPVLDTRLKFNLPKRRREDKYVVIVFDIQSGNRKMLIGVLADNVNDVIAIEEKSILDTPEFGYNYNTEFLMGMIRNAKTFTMILDIDKTLSKDELEILNITSKNLKEVEMQNTVN